MRTARLGSFCIFIALLSHADAQQAFLNLDFETATRGRPWSWNYGGTGYESSLDPSTVAAGVQSFRIRYVNAAQFGSSVAQVLPIAQVRGKHLTVRGAVKTSGITSGNAGLWLRADGPSGTLSLDNGPQAGVAGTTGWQYFTMERDISPESNTVYVGGFQFGNGTAWFDDFSIDVDGVPIAQGAAPYIGEPTAEQLDWVTKSAIPVVTPNAGSGFDDLVRVKEMVGDARIVALGEGTHGTSEFFRMKHRLLEYLATEMGFTIFSIEANMPEAYRLNDYVLNGAGDPRKLLQGMYFWTWNTQEVLDMILWMREFNASGKGRVQFTGFDMQTGAVAYTNVLTFIQQADSVLYNSALNRYLVGYGVQVNGSRGISQSLQAIQNAVAAVHSVWQDLVDRRSGYLEKYPAEQVDWIIQNARVYEQATAIVAGGSAYRDQSMAENAKWILDQNPGARMVIWAHNYHVSRMPGAMGSYMASKLEKDYLVVGQIFHEGMYSAVNNGRVVSNNAAVPSFPGTIEYVLHSSGIPGLILDLRSASPEIPGSTWLLGMTQYRSIGALAVDGFTFAQQLTTDYDALVFFDQTTASSLLPFN